MRPGGRWILKGVRSFKRHILKTIARGSRYTIPANRSYHKKERKPRTPS